VKLVETRIYHVEKAIEENGRDAIRRI